MIRSSTEVQRSRRGEAGGRFVAYVPYDPSAETPDEGGTNGHPPCTWDRRLWCYATLRPRPRMRCPVRRDRQMETQPL